MRAVDMVVRSDTRSRGPSEEDTRVSGVHMDREEDAGPDSLKNGDSAPLHFVPRRL